MYDENVRFVLLLILLSLVLDGNFNLNTVLVLGFDYWLNFCDVFVNVMFGKMVLLIIVCYNNNNIWKLSECCFFYNIYFARLNWFEN